MSIIDEVASGTSGTIGGTTNTAQTWDFLNNQPDQNPFALGTGGEYFRLFTEKLNKIYESLVKEQAGNKGKKSVEVEVIPFSNNTFTELRFSVIAILVKNNITDDKILSYHTLILENTGPKLSPEQRQENGVSYHVNLVTSHAWDEQLRSLLITELKRQYPGYDLISANATAVLSHIDPTNDEQLIAIARNSAIAAYTQIRIAVGDVGDQLDLTKLNNNVRLTLDISVGQHQISDIQGNPRRATILLNLSASSRDHQHQNKHTIAVNGRGNSAQVFQLAGYINPIWAPAVATPTYGYAGQPLQYIPGAPLPSQKLLAELVITSVFSPITTSPAAYLLALANIFKLSEDNTWIQTLLAPRRDTTGGGKVDLTDITALNIPVNAFNDPSGFGGRVDAETLPTYEKKKIYLETIFRQGLAVSIDVPVAEADSWALGIFGFAATGDSSATDVIIHALDVISGGHFSRIYDSSEPIFNNVSKIPLGYYYAADGSKQDIRNIDYIAISNLFANNPQRIHEFTNAFIPRPNVSEFMQLANIEAVINEAVGGNAVITGYAYRVRFSQGFLQAFSKSVAATNVSLDFNPPIPNNVLQNGIYVPAGIDNAVFNPIGQTFRPAYSPNVYSRGYAPAYPGHGYGR
jgi:hypothetical protein